PPPKRAGPGRHNRSAEGGRALQCRRRDGLVVPGTTSMRTGWRLPRVRMSLRAFMALVLALGAGLGYFVLRARDQQAAVEAIRGAGGSVVYSWQCSKGYYDPRAKPGLPGWLLDTLGPDWFYRVKMVRPGGQRDKFDDALMAHVGRLRDVEELSLNACENV